MSTANKRPALILFVVCGFYVSSTVLGVCVAIATNNTWRWLEGATNGSIPGLYLNLISIGVAVIALCSMVMCVASYCVVSTREHRQISVLVFVMVLIGVLFITPCAVVRRTEMDAFVSGFVAWTESQPNLRSSNGKLAGLVLGPAGPAPDWWPVVDETQWIGKSVAPTEFRPLVRGPLPDEVRMLQPSNTLVLSWWGRKGGWKRFVALGGVVPKCLDSPTMRWQPAGEAMFVGVQEQH